MANLAASLTLWTSRNSVLGGLSRVADKVHTEVTASPLTGRLFFLTYWRTSARFGACGLAQGRGAWGAARGPVLSDRVLGKAQTRNASARPTLLSCSLARSSAALLKHRPTSPLVEACRRG